MGVGKISSDLGQHRQLHLQTEVCFSMGDDGGRGGEPIVVISVVVRGIHWLGLRRSKHRLGLRWLLQ